MTRGILLLVVEVSNIEIRDLETSLNLANVEADYFSI